MIMERLFTFVPRRVATLASGLLLGAALLWLGFEAGQLAAGHNRAAMRAELGSLERELAAAQAREQSQQERIVMLETDSQVSAAAYRQVEERLAEFQSTIVAQQEDLAFFRGLVSEPVAGEEIRIQNVVIAESLQPASYTLQIVLAQPMGRERRVSGHLEIAVEGSLGQAALTLPLAELTGNEVRQDRLDYAFRYFQNVEADIALPDGFVPASLLVRLVPSGRSGEPREERFDWRPRSG